MTDFFATSFAIPETGPAMPAGPLCPGDLPLVLLPVRLETRFFTLADDSTELRVRVFPDKIHLDSHEPELTADEQRWGQHYWEQDWRAGDDSGAARDAWRQLADAMGAQRAAWIVRVLAPTNADQRPTSPTPPDQPLPVAPVFAPITVAVGNETWRHPPQARLLPDRWLAVVHSAGRVALTGEGNQIRRPLAVGPDPQAPEPDEATEAAIAQGEQLAIDAGMKWMTDFDDAESVGMALRIPIPADTLAVGLDSLVVFGVSRSLSVAERTAALADLFDAHHYTDGLAFIRPGTPTNNTDDRRAGYNADDPGHERSFAIEIADTPALDYNNALRVGTALGLSSDRILATFGRVERGLEDDDRHARSMNTALWQVGWGYYLSNMIGAEAGITQDDIDWARQHFLEHVRSFGPLPALRCGAQPYGLLPVTSLDVWDPWAHDSTGPDIWLNRMLRVLRDGVWRPAAGSVARIGNRQNDPDPDADLADVMRTDGLSSSYLMRPIFGGQFLRHLYRFLGTGMPGSDPAQTALLEQLGIAWRPRLSRIWNGGGWNVRAPLVQPGEVSPWAALEPNYIAALLAEHSIDNLILARPDPRAPDRNLLQALLRHAYLREIASAAARLLAQETGADLAGLLRDAELVDLVTGEAPTLHWKRQLGRTVAVAGGHTIREYLESALSHGDGTFQPARLVLSYFGVNDGWQVDQHPRVLADLTGDGRADIVGFRGDGVWTALNNGDGTFQPAQFVPNDFGVNQGWRVDQHPRVLADLTGDGRADIVGFGGDGVLIGLNTGDGTFQAARLVLSDFGVAQGWRVDQHPRVLADLTGDGRADIVGFGDDGVWTALNTGDGTFQPARLVLSDFGVAQGWRVDQHPRVLADLTGDGRADIVGFRGDGVWTALNNGDGTFQPAQFVPNDFGVNQGWRVDQHPRVLADLTGDGRADIVGFGDDGVSIALNTGDGTFQPAQLVLSGFGVNQGWRVDQHPRVLADLTGDGRADIVGFGDDGVRTALNTGDGTFQPAQLVLSGFGVNPGWRVDQHPRVLADLTGDGRADIVGFRGDGVRTALNNGDGTFQPAQFVPNDFGVNQGWRVDQHPRVLADLTGDGRADIVGFGDDGVSIALNTGDGTFQAAQLVLSDFGVNQGWRVDQHPRVLADLTGDGRADIVGFGDDGVRTALNTGDGTFQAAQLVLSDFGVAQGWRVDQHPRVLADLTGDGRADIVGFRGDGVWTALNNGDGTFQPAQFVPNDFGVNQGWRVDQHPRVLADLTGDGRADIVGFGGDGVLIGLNNGDGTFQPAQLVLSDFGVAQGWRVDQHPRVLADLTGDGRADIVGFGGDGVLIALNTFTTPALSAVGEFRSSLADLQHLDSEALSHLMQGTLDLSAHRLDAWVTSVATKRLAAMRTDGPTGQYIGGYGWVENLRPMNPSLVTPIPAPPPGEPGPLQAAPYDSGFIHAPSVTHAAAAALLRNAHLGPTGVPSATAPFAIDLSSRRVREASRLLEGVRHGQPLGALLGYRVERALHDTVVDNGRSLDRFIAPLRRLAPLVARATTQTSAPVEAIAADNVVDGLVLHRRWTEEPDVRSLLIADVKPPPPTDLELQALDSIITALGEAIDGLTDALTAELAYQMVRGNTARIASTLAAISSGGGASPPPEGAAPPPELEVTRIPRSGTSLTHRLLLLSSGPPGATAGWASFDTRARSAAEPLLNFWAFQLLGDPSRVRCTIERLDEATGEVAETRTMPLSELALAPLDVVYGVDAANTTAQPGIVLSEVEQQVLYHAKRTAGGFDPDALLRLQHDRPADLSAAEVTLFDLLEQARAVRGLLAVARGADPDDLTPPERAAQAAIDLHELEEERVVTAENALHAAHTGAVNLIAGISTTTTAEDLRAMLLRLGSFGVGPAVPVSVSGDDAAAKEPLAQQGRALLKLSDARLQQGKELRAAPKATDPRGRLQQLAARMRAVFGPSFVVAPRFTLDAAGATEFGSALAASTAAQGGDPLAAHTWFGRCARVRDAVARLASCLQRAEVLGTGARLDLSVAQLPFVTNEHGVERWVGLAPRPETVLPPSKLSLVIQTLDPITTTQVISGLLVDEWVEVVPSSHETTALAFQFDTPDSCAPQCVLIAVPPSPGQDWTAETLRRVLMETLDLAKLRGVDTRSLGAAAQHLPGLYLAFNTKDHAVSTDFTSLLS